VHACKRVREIRHSSLGAAAGGIALINSIGNPAGFAAPYMIGALKTSTGKLMPITPWVGPQAR